MRDMGQPRTTDARREGRCTPRNPAQTTLANPLSRPHCLAALLVLLSTTPCQLAGALPASSPAGIREGSGNRSRGVVLRGEGEVRPAELLEGAEVPGTGASGTDEGANEVPGIEDTEVPDEGVTGTGVAHTGAPESRALGRSMRGSGRRDPAAHGQGTQGQKDKHRLWERVLREATVLGVPRAPTPHSSLTAPSPTPSITGAEAPTPFLAPSSAGGPSPGDPPSVLPGFAQEVEAPGPASDSPTSDSPAPGPASGDVLAPHAMEVTPSSPFLGLPKTLHFAPPAPGAKGSGDRGSDSASGGAPPLAMKPPVPPAQPSGPPAQPGEWRPQRGKFLLAICLYGRMSNQLSCMRAYFRAALLTNRALLVPTWGVAVNAMRKVDYTFPWDVPVDWARMAQCLAPGYGNETVMTVKEYLKQYGKARLNVSNFRGLQRDRDWAWRGGGGGVVKEFRRLNAGELDIPDLDGVPATGWLQHIPGRLAPADVAALGAGIQDDVITFGELFNSFLDRHLPPLKVPDPSCANLWRPHPGIMEFVEGVQRVKIGGAYGALHFRRGDFYAYVSKKGTLKPTEQTFPSVAAAATRVRAWLQRSNLTRLFVATNARLLELDIFKAVVSEPVDGFKIQVVVTLRDLSSDPEWLKQQPWAQAALALNNMEGMGGLVWSIIDKYLCVYADLFWASAFSTFSGEINWTLRPYESQGKVKQG